MNDNTESLAEAAEAQRLARQKAIIEAQAKQTFSADDLRRELELDPNYCIKCNEI